MPTRKDRTTSDTASRPKGQKQFTIEHRGRFWAVFDPAGELVCLAVYRRGAREVVRRLAPDVG